MSAPKEGESQVDALVGGDRTSEDQTSASDDQAPIACPRRNSVSGLQGPVVDPVFGAISEDGPNYRNLGWIGTSILMMKTQIGLGVLSIPSAFNVLGIIPGLVILLVVGALTTWSNYMVGVFKLKHPNVYGLDDVGRMLFEPFGLGRVGKEFLAFAFVLFWIFVGGSGILGVSIALNALSGHITCTAAWVIVAAVVGCGLASVKTLTKVSVLAWGGVFCILTAIFIVTIAVGVQNHPISVDGFFPNGFKLVGNPSFIEGVTAISSIIFAFSGTPAFLSIAAEMRDPEQYTKALFLCQTVVTSVYGIIGCIVYYYCGSHVASPALGSAGGELKKVAFGFALPGLWVTTMLVIHIAAKYLHVRYLRGSPDLTSNSRRHNIVWFSCTVGVTIVAWLVASCIPGFGGLVSLIGASLGTLMSFQPMGGMWLYDNWSVPKARKGWGWKCMFVVAVSVIVIGSFMMVAGTYGSIVMLMAEYKKNGVMRPFTCADNSNAGTLR